MVAMRILLVHLQLRRNTLFTHEHPLAYFAGFDAGGIPVAEADGKRWCGHGRYNTRLPRE